MLFFYSRVTPLGGTATNAPTKMYHCVLLCTTNESGGRRAPAGEQESNTYRYEVAVYHTYSGEQNV